MPRASILHAIPTPVVRKWVDMCTGFSVFKESDMAIDFPPALVSELVGVYTDEDLTGIHDLAFLRTTMEGLAGNTSMDLPAAYYDMRESASPEEEAKTLKRAVNLLLDRIEETWDKPHHRLEWVVVGRKSWQTGCQAHTGRMQAEHVVLGHDENGDPIVVDEADKSHPISVKMGSSKMLTLNVEEEADPSGAVHPANSNRPKTLRGPGGMIREYINQAKRSQRNSV